MGYKLTDKCRAPSPHPSPLCPLGTQAGEGEVESLRDTTLKELEGYRSKEKPSSKANPRCAVATQNHEHDNKLVDAYNRMMARIREAIETADADAVPSLQKAIDMARQQAIHLGEITQEEAEAIGNYIKRDVNDAAEYLMETSHAFSEWLMLDIEIIEQKILELFLSVADKTRVELEQLSHPHCDVVVHEYHSGEITGPGTLLCANCNQRVQFHTTRRIPPCPKCHHTIYKRAEK
jgi:hypothetical protein